MNLTFTNSLQALGVVALAASCTATTAGGNLAVTSAPPNDHERDNGKRAAQAAETENQRPAIQRPRAIGGGPIDGTVRFTPDAAVVKIASAQCNREARCKEFGPGEKYASRPDCVSNVENERKNQINATNCPREIGAEALNSCLQALDEDDCTSAMSAAARTNACQLMNLCVK